MPARPPKASRPAVTMRLNKYLAHAGVCSRRQADEAIEAGRVAIDGKTVREHGTMVDPDRHAITLDGVAVDLPRDRMVYVAFNKPRGVTSTVADPHAKKTVVQYMPKRLGRLFPVGRLDKDSQGLMLLTNDGELTQRLSHPSFEVEKEYIVSLERKLTPPELDALKGGEVRLEDGSRAGRIVVIAAPRSSHGYPRYFFILREGRNREIRQVVAALGVGLKRLKRLRIGPVMMGVLPAGDWRFLTTEEEKELGVFGRSLLSTGEADLPDHVVERLQQRDVSKLRKVPERKRKLDRRRGKAVPATPAERRPLAGARPEDIAEGHANLAALKAPKRRQPGTRGTTGAPSGESAAAAARSRRAPGAVASKAPGRKAVGARTGSGSPRPSEPAGRASAGPKAPAPRRPSASRPPKRRG